MERDVGHGSYNVVVLDDEERHGSCSVEVQGSKMERSVENCGSYSVEISNNGEKNTMGCV
ncbi:hypothetical protein Csa_020041 [Cucumis sativus]|uniref:Uncharacterized protein n=1 Tax=Cucumis sativus TaxID=3659 RepID=A0A0A0LZM5_CUCSA|nr:hypothetical protein Csa_020041 [Cucumis sativus]